MPEQVAVALDWLMNMRAPLNFRHPHFNRLDDRNAKILFKHRDDAGASKPDPGCRCRPLSVCARNLFF
jgi:hypothetical protein